MERLTDHILKYLETRFEKKDDTPTDQKIAVNEAVGAIAFYYEKIRNVVDYQDEHLIRQNAIRRILGRRLILENAQEDIALGILKELVRYRYFPNNSVPTKMVKEIAAILSLYLGVIKNLSEKHELADKDQDWLISMAACSIDEHLVPMKEEHALVNLMYSTLEGAIAGKSENGDDAMRKLQVYIAIYRILLRPDIDRLRHFLLLHNFPEWKEYGNPDVERLSSSYRSVAKKIDSVINHPLNRKILPSLRRFRIAFVVLFTVIRNGNEHLLQDKEALEKEVTRICEGFYAIQKKKLAGRTLRAFVYIFLTKMVLGLAIELPYDMLILHHINTLPLVVNVVFPPLFLAALVGFVKMPEKENTKRIIKAVHEIVYPDAKKEVFATQRYSARKKSPLMTGIFWALYLALFWVSFGLVAWGLEKLNFNIVSAIVFVVFFCMISFFGLNLRRSIQDLVIIKPKTNLLITLIESFFLPIVSVGRWLSFNISRINIFVFIFDVLIELPLQALLEITEEWFAFLKEKKEELE